MPKRVVSITTVFRCLYTYCGFTRHRSGVSFSFSCRV